jgi:flagellar biosynthesis/type III secretory pathway protein FliH
MVMNKYVVVLMSLAFLGTGCKKKYEEGFAAGEIAGVKDGRVAGTNEGYADGKADGQDIAYDSGYADGNAAGYTDGYNEAEAYFSTAGYNEGFNDATPVGLADGREDGYDDGYQVGYDGAYTPAYNAGVVTGLATGQVDGEIDGLQDGEVDGYEDGYNAAYEATYNANYDYGLSDGITDGSNSTTAYNLGYDATYSNSYDAGYSDGDIAGTNDGATDGYADGYDVGWTDGYNASYGLNQKSNNPVVKLAMMVNKDLIDYNGLKKFNSQAASASLGMSAGGDASVDMEKLAALKEQHFLNQMASQLEVKFGLSAERSSELATVVHQFNQLAGTRELTDKDANAFAKEIIGTSLKDVDAAVRASLKGNSEMLNVMIDDIATHNQTSTEKVNAMISQIFF